MEITENIQTTNEAVKITFSGYNKGEKLYKNTSQIIKVKIEYNPDFNDHIEKPWTTTLIKDFHGKVRIIVNENKISSYDEYEVSVIGEGNINFKTSQSGL